MQTARWTFALYACKCIWMKKGNILKKIPCGSASTNCQHCLNIFYSKEIFISKYSHDGLMPLTISLPIWWTFLHFRCFTHLFLLLFAFSSLCTYRITSIYKIFSPLRSSAWNGNIALQNKENLAEISFSFTFCTQFTLFRYCNGVLVSRKLL